MHELRDRDGIPAHGRELRHSVALVAGKRREVLSVDDLYGSASLDLMPLHRRCALLQPPPSKVGAPLRQGEVLSAHTAASAVTVGGRNKAEVRAALGEAVVFDFESGYEVWVYRETP